MAKLFSKISFYLVQQYTIFFLHSKKSYCFYLLVALNQKEHERPKREKSMGYEDCSSQHCSL